MAAGCVLRQIAFSIARQGRCWRLTFCCNGQVASAVQSRRKYLHLLIAAVLIVSAALKTSGVLGQGTSGHWWLLPAVLCEVVLALWLATGLYPQRATQIAIVAFALFAGVSLGKAVAGETSCGCFGNLEVNPWVTFVADCGAILLLAVCLQAGRQSEERARRGRVIAALAVLCFFPMAIVIGSGLDARPFRQSLTEAQQIANVLPADLMNGVWQVTLVRASCPACS